MPIIYMMPWYWLDNQLLGGRAILDELGILEEARDRETEPTDKARTGQVVDFQAFRNRRR